MVVMEEVCVFFLFFFIFVGWRVEVNGVVVSGGCVGFVSISWGIVVNGSERDVVVGVGIVVFWEVYEFWILRMLFVNYDR